MYLLRRGAKRGCAPRRGIALCPRFQCPGSRQTANLDASDSGYVCRSMVIFRGHVAETPTFFENSTQRRQHLVCGRRFVLFHKGGSNGGGVLVPERCPRRSEE